MTASSLVRIRTWWTGAVARRCFSCSGVLPAGRAAGSFCSDSCADSLGRSFR